MIDLDALGAELGLKFEGASPQPVRPVVPLTAVGERMRDELLHELGATVALVQMLEETVRSSPENDVAFDAIDEALARKLTEAGGALRRFRDRRECQGVA